MVSIFGVMAPGWEFEVQGSKSDTRANPKPLDFHKK